MVLDKLGKNTSTHSQKATSSSIYCFVIGILTVNTSKRERGNLLNPFDATGFFRYPLKTSENIWFSDVFRGYRKRPVAWNRLRSKNKYFTKSWLPERCLSNVQFFLKKLKNTRRYQWRLFWSPTFLLNNEWLSNNNTNQMLPALEKEVLLLNRMRPNKLKLMTLFCLADESVSK